MSDDEKSVYKSSHDKEMPEEDAGHRKALHKTVKYLYNFKINLCQNTRLLLIQNKSYDDSVKLKRTEIDAFRLG